MLGMQLFIRPTFKVVEDRIIIAINMKVIEKATVFLDSYIYHLDQARLELFSTSIFSRELHADI
jgi:hypothetical protein